jgi:hypothetical protein
MEDNTVMTTRRGTRWMGREERRLRSGGQVRPAAASGSTTSAVCWRIERLLLLLGVILLAAGNNVDGRLC